MRLVSIEEAQTLLNQLIEEAFAGEEVVIVEGDRRLVKLVVVPEVRKQRRLGGAKGIIRYMADDFDAPLEDCED